MAGDGGAIVWPLLVGVARAKEFLLTGDLITATEAERIGLVNRVVPAGQAYTEGLALAQRLVEEDSHNASARLSLAIANYQLSYPLGKTDPAESLRAAQTAIGVLDEDLARSPKDYLLRSRRARGLRYLAYALNYNSRPADARRALEQAIEIQRQLVAEAPSDASEREQLQRSQKVLTELK